MNRYSPPYDFEPDLQAQDRMQRKRRKNRASAVLCTLCMLLCAATLCLLAVLMLPQMTGVRWKNLPNYAFQNGRLIAYDAQTERSYRLYSEYLQQDTLYPGLYVNDVHVGGLTKAEAIEQLRGQTDSGRRAYPVTAVAGDHSWVLQPEQLTFTDDLPYLLDTLYMIGRTDSQSAGRTPFERRCGVVADLRSHPQRFQVNVSYNVQAVQQFASQIAAYVNRDPVNAEIATFDFRTRSFTFAESAPGCRIDEEDLTRKLCTAIERWREGETVTAHVEITQPQVTTEALQKGFGLVAAYTTSTTNEDSRNTNIRLACEAINGTALLPGETFSFNAATGERTTDKGYRAAGAIARGQSIEEVGGGICQVSSTLFNAVARANLEIVSRSPHAWPSSYVTIGQDATVNWPNLDFKFRNNTAYPVFVIAYYQNRKMSAEIWGMSLGDGVSLDLESVTVNTLPAPSEIQYTYNAELPYGTEKTTVKARNGYVVDTYRVWYQNGQETRREKAYSTTYKAYRQINEYNWGSGY